MSIIFLNELRLKIALENPHRRQMILFYSEHCPHCRMLLDTIKRHDPDRRVKLVCIETLARVPSVIHSVPALMTLPEKKCMFGKAVFDYLLLPGSGKLLVAQPQQKQAEQNQEGSSDPAAFVLGAGVSDNFSMYEEHAGDNLGDRVYAWATLQDQSSSVNSQNMPFQEDTRTRKELPDVDYIRQQREIDLRGEQLVNPGSLPPPTATRL